MIIKTNFYTKQKPGRNQKENEDRGFPDLKCEFKFDDSSCYFFAVADGTSSASYSGEWAESLVLNYVAKPDLFFIDYARKFWESFIAEINFKNDFAREKIETEGSAASFIGIKFSKVNDESCKINIFSVGDCCVFICRNQDVILKFPLDDPDKFNDYPDLIQTKIEFSKENKRKIKEFNDIKAGDKIFLMTDALAKWFLTNFKEKYTNYFEKEILKKDAFNFWVDKNRNDGNLEIDDTTVLLIELE